MTTYSSPFAPIPFPFKRSFLPLLIPAGILSSTSPSRVGTRSFVPKTASAGLINIWQLMSKPSLLNFGCGAYWTVKYKSPLGVPALPCPAKRSFAPFFIPAGMLTFSDFVSPPCWFSVKCFAPPLWASSKLICTVASTSCPLRWRW